jgi:hypothetical protein
MACSTSDRITAGGGLYVAPAPRELPELRADLARWLAGTGPSFYLASAMIGLQWLPPRMPPAEGAEQVAWQERQRVIAGDLYWVSAAMTDLATHAARSLPTWTLHKHDLPSSRGLMLFEKPVGSYTNREGRHVEIVAASWGPWDGPDSSWQQGGIWLTFYSHPAPVLPPGAYLPGGPGGWLPPVLPDNEAGWPFGDLDFLPPRVEGTTVQWARAVRAAWLLMRQPLAEQTRERASRPARRRLARDGITSPSVRVIHVRRSQHPAAGRGDGDPARQYSCQWWVNGHWRTYWCGPGRQRREDRWISPYVAGPDGKPVRGTERVQVWDR